MVTFPYTAAPRIETLGEAFYDVVTPASFPRHDLRFRNQRWAERIGLGDLDEGRWIAHFARFAPLPGNLERPLALRYHGNQFDVYNPSLGDGRGFLFAQLLDGEGRLLDLGTKGSGTTPWSRRGDGRLTLKGGVREVLATEMLEALGVTTSKSLSLVETGEALMRGDEPSPTRSSVLVRVNHSHVRIGTFQRLAYLRDRENMERLFAYCIANFDPHIDGDLDSRVAAFLAEVTRRTAKLVAGWMVAGFVHGVLNSDNMTITGESFDYGPWRFLPTYDLDFVAAYFDHGGLYAYGRQPRAAFKNLTRLAEALRLIAPATALAPALADFASTYEAETTKRVLWRLGLASNGDVDEALVTAIFAHLGKSTGSFDRFFFDVRNGDTPPALAELLALYERRPLDRKAPATMLIDDVERVWSAIDRDDDWSLFEAKIAEVRAFGDALRASGDPPV